MLVVAQDVSMAVGTLDFCVAGQAVVNSSNDALQDDPELGARTFDMFDNFSLKIESDLGAEPFKHNPNCVE